MVSRLVVIHEEDVASGASEVGNREITARMALENTEGVVGIRTTRNGRVAVAGRAVELRAENKLIRARTADDGLVACARPSAQRTMRRRSIEIFVPGRVRLVRREKRLTLAVQREVQPARTIDGRRSSGDRRITRAGDELQSTADTDILIATVNDLQCVRGGDRRADGPTDQACIAREGDCRSRTAEDAAAIPNRDVVLAGRIDNNGIDRSETCDVPPMSVTVSVEPSSTPSIVS